jgi:hypothetical protein
VYCFYLLFVSDRYCFDVVIYKNLQDLKEQVFEQQLAEK